jgi:hypothetical protein
LVVGPERPGSVFRNNLQIQCDPKCLLC